MTTPALNKVLKTDVSVIAPGGSDQLSDPVDVSQHRTIGVSATASTCGGTLLDHFAIRGYIKFTDGTGTERTISQPLGSSEFSVGGKVLDGPPPVVVVRTETGTSSATCTVTWALWGTA